MRDQTSLRKFEHIMIAFAQNVESGKTLLEEVYLVHQALPEVNLNHVDTTVEFLGKKLSIPLMITGMTGGHSFAGEVNRALARAAERHNIAIGVGSQRAALINPDLKWTFRVVREEAPTVPVVANIGAPQLVKGDPLKLGEAAVAMIEADALAIHLNPGQEVFQPEGDVDYAGVVKSIRKLVENLDVPVIVKETGSGISMETARKLRQIGVNLIDTSGAGGTNWIKVEALRALEKGEEVLGEAGKTFSDWGIPTSVSIIETRWAHPEAFIIASGGMRTGLDIAKAISIGADMGGMALPMLRSVLRSEKTLDKFIMRVKYEFRASLYLTGSGSVEDFRRKTPVLGIALTNWLRQRGVEPREYMRRLVEGR